MTRAMLIAAVGVLTLGSCGSRTRADGPMLMLERTIPLPGVHGRIDHMTISDGGRRLFIAAIGNDSVEVVDLQDGARTDSIIGLDEPQDVKALPGNRVIVSNGGSSSAAIYDAHTLTLLRNIPLRSDPDNIRFDIEGKRVYIGCGGRRDGALAVLDPEGTEAPGFIELPGHPESFQLEAHGPRIFVNVPSAREVTVADRASGRAVAHWPIVGARANFPMALDEGHARLFIGCRDPARLLVLDTHDGTRVAELECVADADDIFYDAPTRRLYVSGGGGAVAVFRQDTPDQYTPVDSVGTRDGARTALFDPERRRLYLGVPARGSASAEIREFHAAPAD